MLANQLFPNWLITVLLLLLLIFLTHMTVKKALSLHRAEVLYKAEQAADTCSSARAKADSSEGHASASSAQQQGDAAARAADFCEAGSSSDGAPEGGARDGRGKAAAGTQLSHACASLEVEQPVSLLLWAVHKMLQSHLAMWNSLYPGSCMLAAARKHPEHAALLYTMCLQFLLLYTSGGAQMQKFAHRRLSLPAPWLARASISIVNCPPVSGG